MSRIRRLCTGPIITLTTLSCAVVIVAGCGSSDAASGTVTAAGSPSAKSSNQALEFARCMRGHGVSDFPDPTGGGIRITPSIAQSPNFQSAQNACKQYMPNGGQPPVTAPGARKAALAFAECMRAHGEPDFPDPLFSAPSSQGRGVAVLDLRGMTFQLPSGLDPVSPAFEQAASHCGVTLPAGPGAKALP